MWIDLHILVRRYIDLDSAVLICRSICKSICISICRYRSMHTNTHSITSRAPARKWAWEFMSLLVHQTTIQRTVGACMLRPSFLHAHSSHPYTITWVIMHAPHVILARYSYTLCALFVHAHPRYCIQYLVIDPYLIFCKRRRAQIYLRVDLHDIQIDLCIDADRYAQRSKYLCINMHNNTDWYVYRYTDGYVYQCRLIIHRDQISAY